MAKKKLTKDELRDKIKQFKLEKQDKEEREKLENELKDLENSTNNTKKALKVVGKIFLGIGKSVGKYAKNQSEKKR